ncbi:AAA family ATPase [Alicyclobacillus herbarius]|uniref:AAA family ATPase n=1 Tax=Alicyclobacillus herbarius TaxID=122960 RepID=UPI0004142F8F|nr:AAA family ATPase [Alicyclobacillus herbarius]
MKLRRLELHHVGPHHGPVLEGVGDGLTIVFGDNEAGKSSLLAGLRGLLFGRVVSAEPRLIQRQGAHGVLIFETDGQLWRLERSLDRRRRPLLYDPEGNRQAGEAALRQAVPELNVVEDLVYQSVFTFQLEELSVFTPEHRAVSERLFVVDRLGRQSPAALESELLRRAKALFNPDPRARRPELTQCLLDLETLHQARSQQSDSAAAYRAVRQELEQERTRLAELTQALRRATDHYQHAERLKSLYPLFIEASAAESRLAAAIAASTQAVLSPSGAGTVVDRLDGRVDLESAAQETLRRLRACNLETASWSWSVQKVREGLPRLQRLRAEVEDLRRSLTLFPDPGFLDPGFPDAGGFEPREVVEDPAHMAELEAMAQEDERLSRKLEASEQALQEAVVMRADREEQLRQRGFTEDAERELADRRALAEQRLEQLAADTQRLQAMLQKTRDLAALRRVRDAAGSEKRTQPRLGVSLGFWVAAVLSLGAVAAALFQRAFVAALTVLGALAAVWSIGLRAAQAAATARRKTHDVEAEAAGLRADIEQMSAELATVTVDHTDESGLLAALAAVSTAQRRQEQDFHQFGLDAQLVQAWREACARVEWAAREKQACRLALHRHRVKCARWYREHGGQLAEDDVRPARMLAEFRRQGELRQRLQAVRHEAENVVSTVTGACRHLASFGLWDPAQAPTAAEVADNPARLQAWLDRAQTGLDALRRQEEDALQELEDALADWRRARAEAQGKAGGLDAWQAACRELRGETEGVLTERLQAARRELESLRQDEEVCIKRVGELESRLNGWSRTFSDIDWQIGELSARRDALAKRWAVYKLAEALLKEARARHQATRQPRTLQTAAAILNEASHGRYPQLRTEETEAGGKLVVIDAHGRAWEPAELSRGTRELAALSLRLALIQDYRERGVQLPVVIDDALVNLDGARLAGLLEVIRATAEEQQILYLTCQTAVRVWAETHGIDVIGLSHPDGFTPSPSPAHAKNGQF